MPRPVKLAPPPGPTFAREIALHEARLMPVAGVDEAGRGPLAGPVVAAAVILDPNDIPPGLDDSKKLDQAAREALFAAIVATAEISVASANCARIERDNIRGATLWAMARAVEGLPRRPAHVLVDGKDRPPVTIPCDAIVDGDALCLSIAAASIVAKVMRDRMMADLARHHPQYGFERHKGYGTAAHLAALKAHGPTRYHRMGFAPLRQGDLFKARS